MKKTLKNLSAVAIIITAVFASCSKEFESAQNDCQAEDGKVILTILPPAQDSFTKITTSETASELLLTGWELGDKLYAYQMTGGDSAPVLSDEVEFTCFDAANGKFSGYIEGKVSSGDDLNIASNRHLSVEFDDLALDCSTIASTDFDEICILTGERTGTGAFQMEVQGNILAIDNQTGIDKVAALKYDSGSSSWVEPVMFRFSANEWVGGYCYSTFDETKFTIEKNTVTYVTIFPSASESGDTASKIGVAQYYDEQGKELVGMKNIAYQTNAQMFTKSIVPVEVSTDAALKTALNNGGDVKMTDDLCIPNKTTFSSDFTLDLNGKTLTLGSSEDNKVSFKGNVEIAGGTIVSDDSKGETCLFADLGCRMTLTDVTLETEGNCLWAGGNGDPSVVTLNDCVLTSTDNTVMSSENQRYTYSPICISRCAVVNINGGTYTGGYYAASIASSGGTINIYGGTFNTGTTQGAKYSILNDAYQLPAYDVFGYVNIYGDAVIHGSIRGRTNNADDQKTVINIQGGIFDSGCQLVNFTKKAGKNWVTWDDTKFTVTETSLGSRTWNVSAK